MYINKNLIVLERIVKLLELVSNPFVFVYTIRYVQFINNYTYIYKKKHAVDILKKNKSVFEKSGPHFFKILTCHFSVNYELNWDLSTCSPIYKF